MRCDGARILMITDDFVFELATSERTRNAVRGVALLGLPNPLYVGSEEALLYERMSCDALLDEWLRCASCGPKGISSLLPRSVPAMP